MDSVNSKIELVASKALEQPVHEPVKTVTTVVVCLSTGDIVVTTFSDGSFTVESKSVTVTENLNGESL
jgi:hypothetical protein